MPYHWPADTVFQELTLEVEQRTCWQCEHPLTICCHRQRRFFTAEGPVQLLSKLCHCSNATCPVRATTLSPEAETALVTHVPHRRFKFSSSFWHSRCSS